MSFYDSFSEREDLRKAWDGLFAVEDGDEASRLAKEIYRQFLEENYGEICREARHVDAMAQDGRMTPEQQP